MSAGANGVKNSEGVMVLTPVIMSKYTISLPFIFGKDNIYNLTVHYIMH